MPSAIGGGGSSTRISARASRGSSTNWATVAAEISHGRRATRPKSAGVSSRLTTIMLTNTRTGRRRRAGNPSAASGRPDAAVSKARRIAGPRALSIPRQLSCDRGARSSVLGRRSAGQSLGTAARGDAIAVNEPTGKGIFGAVRRDGPAFPVTAGLRPPGRRRSGARARPDGLDPGRRCVASGSRSHRRAQGSASWCSAVGARHRASPRDRPA